MQLHFSETARFLQDLRGIIRTASLTRSGLHPSGPALSAWNSRVGPAQPHADARQPSPSRLHASMYV